VSWAKLKGELVCGWPRIAAVVLILALLAFTTIRTSALNTGFGPGSSLAKTTPKQRHSRQQDFAWTQPALNLTTLVVLDSGDVIPAESNDPISDHFLGRYFSLPPPKA
jgi:hypothetical protein